MNLMKNILREARPDDLGAPKSVGIVTPYSGQVSLIRKRLAADNQIFSLSKSTGVSIEVNSVDGYQGREQDIILFSAVRSNRRGKVGFLADWRRLNVALTRARSAIIVVGDTDTLTAGNSYWAAFHKWCDGLDCVVDQSSLP